MWKNKFKELTPDEMQRTSGGEQSFNWQNQMFMFWLIVKIVGK